MLLLFSCRLRRYIKHSRQCFIPFPNISNFANNTPLRVLFPTLSIPGVWKCDETQYLVFVNITWSSRGRWGNRSRDGHLWWVNQYKTFHNLRGRVVDALLINQKSCILDQSARGSWRKREREMLWRQRNKENQQILWGGKYLILR